jgi:hypothetical protein
VRFAIKPVRLLVKLPVPVPLMVLVFNKTVGLIDSLQHTPRAVIADPPSFEILPPLEAEAVDIEFMLLVVILGKQPPHIGTPSQKNKLCP